MPKWQRSHWACSPWEVLPRLHQRNIQSKIGNRSQRSGVCLFLHSKFWNPFVFMVIRTEKSNASVVSKKGFRFNKSEWCRTKSYCAIYKSHRYLTSFLLNSKHVRHPHSALTQPNSTSACNRWIPIDDSNLDFKDQHHLASSSAKIYQSRVASPSRTSLC